MKNQYKQKLCNSIAWMFCKLNLISNNDYQNFKFNSMFYLNNVRLI